MEAYLGNLQFVPSSGLTCDIGARLQTLTLIFFLFLFSYEANDTELLAGNQSVAKEHKPKPCFFWSTLNHRM